MILASFLCFSWITSSSCHANMEKMQIDEEWGSLHEKKEKMLRGSVQDEVEDDVTTIEDSLKRNQRGSKEERDLKVRNFR